ncbi:HelD family protein [Actinomadura algeriensis]|uniref:DNA helicase IV n=1 Tax=Actinomadura algeriensis TaxID=1679523 RepID=A0ABR9JW56_9ACTN|nr:AAA family ATPase [Actinomadura algeriensis]MBE1534792.1 DNA helicase IV [Actinomadura algeriensis]
MDDTAASAEIRAERAHLHASRAALRRMRDDVLTTRTALGDEVADKYTNEMLRRARVKRAEDLSDVPSVPLFFGRLDYPPGEVYEPGPTADGPSEVYEPGAAGDGPGGDLVYIGRRGVHDATGVPMVVDWRAPIATAFYRAGPKDPMGVRARRRYGFDRGGELTAFEDERLDGMSASRDAETLLATEMERPRSGPMRDIVATIQPEQDELVRAPLERTLCVQGAPGTGKTAIGLHRLAYLLYTERDRLRRGGAAIVGPNRSFLAYIRDVLPALGEVGVTQVTVDELLDPGGEGATREDDATAARIKGDARMAEVIRRDLWSRLAPPADDLVVRRDGRLWRIPVAELAEMLGELTARGVSYGAGRELLTRRIASSVLGRMEARGEGCDERTRGQVQRSRDVRAAVTAMWPKADPAGLVLGLLTDARRLARAADGLLDTTEQAAVLLPRRPRGAKSARWSAADLALIDEAAHLVERRTGLAHVVIDEAQDLSPMQCRAIARRAAGSCTILGDLAQATGPAAVRDWPALLRHLGKPDGRIIELDRGYRVPAQVIDYAARLLPRIAPGLRRPGSARRSAGALRITPGTPGRLAAAMVSACAEALADEGSVGLIAADSDVPVLHRALADAGRACAVLGTGKDVMDAERLLCVPASLAKGLEFEHVIVVEPAHIVRAEPRGLHRLYVVLTRAVSTLRIVHAEPLPDPLTTA